MKFKVDNMSCMHCVKNIEKALHEIGIKKVKIDLETKTVTLVLKKISKARIEEKIRSIGYDFLEV